MGDVALMHVALKRVARAAGVCAAVLLTVAPAQAQHRVVRTAQLDRDGEFRIWNLVGTVRIEAWDKDSIRVEADLDDTAREGFLFGAQGAGGKMTTESFGRSGHADLVLRVPRGATIWVKTMSAPVVVRGLEGVIDVYSVTGDVDIEASATSVYAESMGGRVRVAGASRVVRLRTGSGALEFDGSAADLSLTSVSGSILARASGLRRGIVESVGGRVHLGVSLAPAASLEVLTHDGVVDLALPRGTGAEFLLRTVSGRIRSDLPARGRRPGPGDRDIAFTTGQRHGSVEVRTFSGEIRLRTP